MLKRVKRAYCFGLRIFLNKTFRFWQALGFHITPNHFYAPIPDTRSLKDDLWTCESAMAGVDINEERQFELLAEFSTKFKNEYNFPRQKTKDSINGEYYLENASFESVDAEILYCMIFSL